MCHLYTRKISCNCWRNQSKECRNCQCRRKITRNNIYNTQCIRDDGNMPVETSQCWSTSSWYYPGVPSKPAHQTCLEAGKSKTGMPYDAGITIKQNVTGRIIHENLRICELCVLKALKAIELLSNPRGSNHPSSLCVQQFRCPARVERSKKLAKDVGRTSRTEKISQLAFILHCILLPKTNLGQLEAQQNATCIPGRLEAVSFCGPVEASSSK